MIADASDVGGSGGGNAGASGSPMAEIGEKAEIGETRDVGEDPGKRRRTSEREDGASTLGVNFEGHKISEYALGTMGALHCLNLQIAMDAPFHGDVADEATRSVGPSEEGFEGYDPSVLIAGLTKGVEALRDAIDGAGDGGDGEEGGPVVRTLVVQIARGRRAAAFQRDVVEPVVRSVFDRRLAGQRAGGGDGGGGDEGEGTKKDEEGGGRQARDRPVNIPVLPPPLLLSFHHGYRRTSFFSSAEGSGGEGPSPPCLLPPLAVLNVGMFARLGGDRPRPGEVFACVSGHAIEMHPGTNRPRRCAVVSDGEGASGADSGGEGASGASGASGADSGNTEEGRPRRAWSPMDGGLPRVNLLGLDDSMPFVTPEHYREDELMALFVA